MTLRSSLSRLGGLALALLLAASAASAQTPILISEFEPNPPGSDPSTVSVEVSGPAGGSFAGWLVSLENDGVDGRADRVSQISGTFDANGLLVVEIPDLENPTFTLVLSSQFNGGQGDDLDADDDGVIDDPAGTFGTIYDAIGVSDSEGDDATLYSAQLGGVDVLYNGIFEPLLVFRDASTGDVYQVVTADFGEPTEREVVYTASAEEVDVNEFSSDPTQPTFGAINPTRGNPPPRVLSVDPEDGATDVPAGTDVTLVFSEPVFAGSSDFSLTCDETPISFELTRDPGTPARTAGEPQGTTFVLDPNGDLPADATCDVDINEEGISAVDNGASPVDFSSTFTVVQADDAPFVMSVDPEDGEENVARDASIVVTFSEPVIATPDAFELVCSESGTVDLSVTPNYGWELRTASGAASRGDEGNTTYTLDPNEDLLAGDVCTLTVDADDVTDLDGIDPANPESDFTSTFLVDLGLTVSFTQVQQVVSEEIGTYDLELVLSDIPTAPASVTVRLVSGSPEDLGGFEEATVEFGTGLGETYVLPLTITADGVSEGSEAFVFELTDPMGNDPDGLSVGTPSTFALVVVDGGGEAPGDGAPAWVNEFHYDNGGSDTNEFVEIVVDTEAIDGAGTSATRLAQVDVSDLSLVLYNGNGGAAYATYTFDQFTAGEMVGPFQLYSVDTPGLQNGSPDGIALVLGDEVLQFLSYEGTFSAMDGPAAGLTSVSVGVEEGSDTASDRALALQGDGSTYADFTWAADVEATPGLVNIGQTLDGEGGGGGGGGGGPELSTIAEARAAGVGAEVLIEGTVTRAAGDFLYIQDETGALAIRQTSGALNEAVEAGTVGPGTVLRVTGTIGEFASSLQINGGDLESFEVTGTADVPEPQTVTLNELSLNGEDYEGELVRVVGVTVDGSGTFTAATTYPISDGSGAAGTVTLRVPNEGDTTVDGTPVPSVNVNIVGIVGQFNFDDPTSGYQILVLDEADIVPTGNVATTDGPDAALSLTVANPIRSGSTVTYSVPEAGTASVELYDVLGRRVAVLAAGSVGVGEQTVALDATTLAPGLYVLRLQTEAQAMARTVTVVR